MLPFSVVMIVKNGQPYLAKSLAAWASAAEILVLDNGSTDKTAEIARSFANVHYLYHPDFPGYGQLKQMAVEQAQHDWIFSLDADEIADTALVKSLKSRTWQEQEIGRIYRLNYWQEQPVRACGWQNDFIPRFFHRRYTQFAQARVHEGILLQKDSKIIPIEGTLHHYSYQNWEQMWAKQERYAQEFAKMHIGMKRVSFVKKYLSAGFSFLKSFLLKGGWKYGRLGAKISYIQAWGAWRKYQLLWEKQKT